MAMIELDYNYDEHNTFGLNFYRMLVNGILVDATIVCATHSIRVHKVLLAANSRYLDNLIKAHHPAEPVIIIKGIEVDTLKALIEFMYVGKTKLDESRFPALAAAAERLEITAIKLASMKYDDQSDKLTINNAALFDGPGDLDIYANDPNLPRIIDTVKHPVANPPNTSVICTYATGSEGNGEATFQAIAENGQMFEEVPTEQIEYYDSGTDQENSNIMVDANNIAVADENAERGWYSIVNYDFAEVKNEPL